MIATDTYNLSGTLIPEIAKFYQLKELDFRDRDNNGHLTGPIPSEIGLISFDLSELYLTGHELTGTLPREICNAADMKHMELTSNKLTGTIPNCLYQLTRLQTVLLDDNEFTGMIPSQLGLLADLEDVCPQ